MGGRKIGTYWASKILRKKKHKLLTILNKNWSLKYKLLFSSVGRVVRGSKSLPLAVFVQ